MEYEEIYNDKIEELAKAARDRVIYVDGKPVLHTSFGDISLPTTEPEFTLNLDVPSVENIMQDLLQEA